MVPGPGTLTITFCKMPGFKGEHVALSNFDKNLNDFTATKMILCRKNPLRKYVNGVKFCLLDLSQEFLCYLSKIIKSLTKHEIGTPL